MNGILYISVAVTVCLLGSVFDKSEANPVDPEDRVLQECILKDLNCPADGSLDFKRGRIVYKIVRSVDLPDRCSCDLSNEQCLRGCFYNYLVKSTVLSAVWFTLRTGGNVELVKQTAIHTIETRFKPCLLEGQGCDMIGELDLAQLTAVLANFRVLVDMPADCECDIETDTCARKCFYSVVKKYLDAGVGGLINGSA